MGFDVITYAVSKKKSSENPEVEKQIEDLELKIEQKADVDEVNSELNNKVDKVDGKQLSSNDFSDEYKAKVDSAAQQSTTYSKTEVDQHITAKVAEIVADAPEDFDTLKEMSDWINEHEDSAAAMNSAIADNTTAIATKVDKVAGKGLSTNDFTDADKNKLDDLENYDDADVKADIAEVSNQAAINKATLGYQRKNLLKVTSGTRTTNGVTFTVNADNSVTVNGTASKNTFFEYYEAHVRAGQKLKLSGCPTGGALNSTYRLYVAISNQSELGEGLIFTKNNGEELNVGIEVYAGYTVNNLTFYPMLRYAEITDDTYEPYKPPVDERLNDITNQIFGIGTYIPSGANLNEYTKPGVYTCPTYAISQTLLNNPYNMNGFRLEVSYTIRIPDRFIQKIIPNTDDGLFFTRAYSANGFGSWYKFTGEVVTTT